MDKVSDRTNILHLFSKYPLERETSSKQIIRLEKFCPAISYLMEVSLLPKDVGMCSVGVNTDKTGTFSTATVPQRTLMASVSVSSQFQ